MASSLISGAVALFLILTGGYVIAGGIINIAESTMTAQSDATILLQKNLNSKISILYSEKPTATSFLIGVSNNGSTYYGGSDFAKMDVFIGYENAPVARESITGHYVIINDRVNQNMWDESEIINVSYNLADEPVWVKIVTSNGVTASTNL